MRLLSFLKSHPKNFEAFLSSQISEVAWKSLRQSCADRRFWASMVAEKVGIPEEKLLRTIAKHLKVPFLSRLPSHLDVSPNGIILPLDHLEKLGVLVARTSDGELVYVTSNPDLCAHELKKLPPGQIALAEVRKIIALYNIRKQGERSELSVESDPKVVADKILSRLVTEGDSCGVEKIVIEDWTKDTCRYFLHRTDNKIGRGVIPSHWKSALSSVGEGMWQNNWMISKSSDQISMIRVNKDSVSSCSSNANETSQVLNNRLSESQELMDLSYSPRFLLVDDNPSFGKLIQIFFRSHNFKLDFVNSAQEALGRLNSPDKPDIIISDQNMRSGMSGCEFAKICKSREDLAHIPIILMTSDTDYVVQAKAWSVGCDIFAAKSAHPSVLLAQIENLLARKKRVLRAA